jgi:phage tail tube protein FII
LDCGSLRQQTCNAAGASQATQNAAYVTYYKSVLAAKLAAGLDVGNEIFALQDQLGTAV